MEEIHHFISLYGGKRNKAGNMTELNISLSTVNTKAIICLVTTSMISCVMM